MYFVYIGLSLLFSKSFVNEHESLEVPVGFPICCYVLLHVLSHRRCKVSRKYKVYENDNLMKIWNEIEEVLMEYRMQFLIIP